MTTDPERVDAYRASLIVDGLLYFYALTAAEDPNADDTVYRHGQRSPLYARMSDLATDLEADGLMSEPGIFEVIDLDRALVAARRMKGTVDCDAVLTAWNGLTDLLPVAGMKFDFTGSLADRAYDKLFRGLNLVSITPPGEWFDPRWTSKERRKVVQVIRAGVERTRELVSSQQCNAAPRAQLWADFLIETESVLVAADWGASEAS